MRAGCQSPQRPPRIVWPPGGCMLQPPSYPVMGGTMPFMGGGGTYKLSAGTCERPTRDSSARERPTYRRGGEGSCRL